MNGARTVLKRLLIVTEQFSIGGQETQIAGAIRVLAGRGWHVHLASGSRLPDQSAPPGLGQVFEGLPLGLSATTADLCEAIDRLERIIAELRIDLVHAHPFLSLLPAFVASRRASVPMFVSLHGPCSLESKYGLLHDMCLKFLTLPGCEGVFCVSPELRALARPYLRPSRCHVLPNGVDVHRFRPTDRPRGGKRWAVVGRLDSHKVQGIIQFCEMAAEAGLGPIDIYGDGEGVPGLREFIAERGIQEKVRLMGSRRSVAEALAQAYAGVGGMGRVVLEAAAMNLPVCLIGGDGVKGILSRGLLKKASWWSFSGRGLRNVGLDEFRRQLAALENQDPASWQMRPYVLQHHNEDTIWEAYARQAAAGQFRPSARAEDLYSLLRARCNDRAPYLRDGDLIQDVPELLADRAPAAWLYAQHSRRAGSQTDQHARAIAERLQGYEQQLGVLGSGVGSLAAKLADQSAALASLEQSKARLAQLLEQARATTDKQAKTLQELNERLAERDEQISQLKRELSLKDGEIRKVTAKLREKEDLGDRLAAQNRDLQSLRTELKERGRQVESLRTEREERDRQLDSLGTELEERDHQVESLRTELKERGRQVESLQTKLEERDHQVESLRTELQERDHQVESLRTELEERGRQVESLQTELQEKDHQVESLRTELDQRHHQLGSLRTELEERDRELGSVRTGLEERDRELGSLRTELKEGGRELDSLRTGLEERDRQLHSLREELDERDREFRSLRKELQETERLVHRMDRELQGIYHSTGWAMLKPLYRLRYWVFPSGTRRERLGRAGMHALRRTRYWLGRGLGRVGRAFTPARSAPAGSPTEGGAVAAAGQPAPAQEAAAPPAEAAADLVSVALPVYNQAAFLQESIRSVLTQSYPHLELIVINDGSTDGVEEVLDEFAADPRVRVLTQVHQGLPTALSSAFRFASGKYFTWTSADNVMHPEQLSRLVGFLAESPATEMVYADYLAIDDEGRPLKDPRFRPQNREGTSPEIHLPRTAQALNVVPDNFIGPCFLYRSWVGKLIGEYDPDLGVEDYDYWMRVNSLFRIRHLGTSDTLYSYRVHANTLNARADELKIPRAVERLMAYEADRSAYYQRPWKIFADKTTLKRLRRADTDPHEVVAWSGEDIDGQGDTKVLVLVSAGSLDRLERCALPADRCVAVWFEDDGGAPYVRRSGASSLADVCLAAGQATAERLRLFCDNVFLAARGPDLLERATAFANNRLFYASTRDSALRHREPARMYLPRGDVPKVLLQTDAFAGGGLEKVILELACCLREQGHEPLLTAVEHPGAAERLAREAGIRYVPLPAGADANQYRQLLAEHDISIVNAHHSVFGAEIAADMGIPFVQTLHNTYVWLSPQQIEAHRQADRHTCAYVCVSGDVAMYSDLRLGLPAAKMIIIPNGIDTEAFCRRPADAERDRRRVRSQWNLADDDFVFLNVASIYPPKAQKVIVQALAEVVREHPNTRVLFVGKDMDPEYLAALKRAADSAGLDGHLVFAGAHEDASPFYWAADAFVLPSLWEGCSLALAEAVCTGLPIVASKVGAAEDMVPRANSQLLDPPFGAITELDAVRLHDYVHGDLPEYVHSLAEAMRRTRRSAKRMDVPAETRRRLDRRHAYAGYARLFEWLGQGGRPAAARPWLTSLGCGCPMNGQACAVGSGPS